jgi:hypothetical protein
MYVVGADRLNMSLELAVCEKFESLRDAQRVWNYRQGIVWLWSSDTWTITSASPFKCRVMRAMTRSTINFRPYFTFGNAVREAYHSARLMGDFYSYDRPAEDCIDFTYRHHTTAHRWVRGIPTM